MKEKLTNNLSIKLLTIPLAAIIWLIIINIDDPVSKTTIPNVSVEVLNESSIISAKQVYDVVEGGTVSVTIKAKRSILDKIRKSDIKVTADLENITQFNRVELVPQCSKFENDILELATNPKMLTVTLEESATEVKSVQPIQTGVVDSGYYIDSIKTTPNMIEITGAKSVVEKIAEVRVTVDVSGKQQSFKKTRLSPKVYDENGKEIDSSRLIFSHTDITARVTVLPTKMVPIQIAQEGEPMMGYYITGIEFDPSQIEIAGKAETLSKIYSIPITVNIAGANGDMDRDIDLTQYLPENTKLVGDVAAIAVRIKVKRLATKDFSVGIDDLKVVNQPKDLELVFSAENPMVKITVMGLEEELASLSLEDLNAYIDLEGLGKGKHTVDVKVKLSEGFYLSTSPDITIKLQEKEPEDDNLEGDDQQNPEEGEPPEGEADTDISKDVQEPREEGEE